MILQSQLQQRSILRANVRTAGTNQVFEMVQRADVDQGGVMGAG